MKKIDLDNYPRRALFEAFKDREIPVFSVTSLVEITNFKAFIDEHRRRFFVPLSFLISKAVNRVPELRHRLIEGDLFEFERVDPGFTVLLDDRTFSFCDARHFERFEDYEAHAEARIRAVRQCPDRETGAKHHLFFITNLPWFSFTAISHPFSKAYASIPVIAIGKYQEQGGKFVIPIGIQVHHGLVDGLHVGEFYGHLASLCRAPAECLQ